MYHNAAAAEGWVPALSLVPLACPAFDGVGAAGATGIATESTGAVAGRVESRSVRSRRRRTHRSVRARSIHREAHLSVDRVSSDVHDCSQSDVRAKSTFGPCVRGKRAIRCVHVFRCARPCCRRRERRRCRHVDAPDRPGPAYLPDRRCVPRLGRRQPGIQRRVDRMGRRNGQLGGGSHVHRLGSVLPRAGHQPRSARTNCTCGPEHCQSDGRGLDAPGSGVWDRRLDRCRADARGAVRRAVDASCRRGLPFSRPEWGLAIDLGHGVGRSADVAGARSRWHRRCTSRRGCRWPDGRQPHPWAYRVAGRDAGRPSCADPTAIVEMGVEQRGDPVGRIMVREDRHRCPHSRAWRRRDPRTVAARAR
ncbi:hypothetical protein BH23ACT10_BH23ACT10_13350 [soil metagenome]